MFYIYKILFFKQNIWGLLFKEKKKRFLHLDILSQKTLPLYYLVWQEFNKPPSPAPITYFGFDNVNFKYECYNSCLNTHFSTILRELPSRGKFLATNH